MTADDGQSNRALDGDDAHSEPAPEVGARGARMAAATPRQAILAVAVLCGLCLVIGIALGRTL